MWKISNGREIARKIFGPIILLLCVLAVFAAVIFGYPAFEYESEWKEEQEDFEDYCVRVDEEKQRLTYSSSSAQIYSSKYTLSETDYYGIIFGFINKTLLSIPAYEFMWVKSLTFVRMYEHSFMLNDDPDLKFNKPSTKIVNIVFRSVLPIFATFAIGVSVSAIHTAVTFVTQLFIRSKKYEAWTVGRNKSLRLNVMCSMAVAIAYFAGCFILSSFGLSRWQDTSFTTGIKMTLNLIATVSPSISTVAAISDAHTLAAFFFLINSSVAYLIFSLILLIKTWRISAFAIPLISDIDGANEVDKKVQVQYRSKRAKWFGKTDEKTE